MNDQPGNPAGVGGLLHGPRLARYAVAGGLSAFTHLGTLTFLVEAGAVRPVVASSVGFVLSILVSYTLQRGWVFASSTRHRTAVPRFLTATLVALALNTAVLTLGTEVLSLNYVVVQVVALILIPLSNYLINSLWTFR